MAAVATAAFAAWAAPSSADWQPAVDLSPVGTPVGVPCETGRPSVAASRDGSFLVAWQRKLDAQGNDNTLVEARRIDRDGTAGPLLQLTDAPANVGTVTSGVGPDGSGIVLWHQQPPGLCGEVPGPILLWARRVGSDGALGPVTQVSDPSDKALLAAVGLHRSGDATVAWVDQIGFEQSVLKVRTLPAAGPPGPVLSLTPTAGQAEGAPVVVVDQRDRALVVWDEHGQLEAQRLSPAGDPVGGIIDVTPSGETNADVDAGIAANGEARVVWSHFEPAPVTVLTRTIAADGTVGPIAQVAGGDSPAEPRVAVTASGAAAFAWFTTASVVAFGRTLGPSGAMGPALPLSQTGTGGQMLPTVALANNGQAVAAWQRSLGNTGIVEGAAFSAGGAAGPATQLSQPAASEAFPDLAGNPKGDAVVAWGQETDGGTGMTVQAARFCRHCRR